MARPAEKVTVEPYIWALFSAGGMIAALVLPVLVFLIGVAFPLGWVDPPDHGQLAGLITNPLTKLAVLGICFLCLVHAAHRLRFTSEHTLQIQRYDPLIATVCYGGALVGAAAALYLLSTFP